ncbi:hypothetical protein JHK86_001331 [Glycine max]|nr:hypothetical protein JHK86_001331 [Glycine max]
MEGLTSGFELGLRLNGAEEIKAELKRLKRMKEHEKVVAHFLPFVATHKQIRELM